MHFHTHFFEPFLKRGHQEIWSVDECMVVVRAFAIVCKLVGFVVHFRRRRQPGKIQEGEHHHFVEWFIHFWNCPLQVFPGEVKDSAFVHCILRTNKGNIQYLYVNDNFVAVPIFAVVKIFLFFHSKPLRNIVKEFASKLHLFFAEQHS